MSAGADHASTSGVDPRALHVYVATAVVVVAACSKPGGSEDNNLDGWVGKGTVEVQRGRLATTTADRSASSAEHAPPGVVDVTQSFHYRVHRFTNPKAERACVQVVGTQYTERRSNTGFRVAAYSRFDPENPLAHYLGDSGVTDTTTHRFAFTVEPLAEYQIVVTGAPVGTAAAERGVTYRLEVRDCKQPGGGDRS